MRAAKQLALIAEVVRIAGAVDVEIWARGGWAMDLYLGEVTRDHEDIDFFTWASTADRLTAALSRHGYQPLFGPAVDQQRDFTKEGEELSFALVDVDHSGAMVVAGGSWAGATFPEAAPHHRPGRIGTVRCAVVNPYGQIEIKRLTPVWNPKLRRRAKDAIDIARLRAALGATAPPGTLCGMTDLITVDAIREAAERIGPPVRPTPTVPSPGLADLLGVEVALKLELLQYAGCFKPRGITNKILSLSSAERDAGLLTVSGGNHGLALARITAAMGINATVVMPEAAPARSKAGVQAAGATLRVVPDVATAFETAEKERGAGLTHVHSYDDPLVLAGHGTVGLELIADAPEVTDVLVSIGGGGLISGVATALKAVKPSVRVWGVETAGADAMTRALAAGHPVPVQVTSIASTLGAPIVSDLTLAHVRALVEEVLVVSDAEAVDGVLALAEEAKVWVEPAAGCLLPAARRVVERVGRDAVLGLVLCGGNASFDDITAWAHRFGVRPTTAAG